MKTVEKTILTVRIKDDGYYETEFASTKEETIGAVFSVAASAIAQFKKLKADENTFFCILEEILEDKEYFIALSEEIG